MQVLKQPLLVYFPAQITGRFMEQNMSKKYTVVLKKTSRGIFENVQCFFKNVQCFFQNNGMF